MSAAITRDELDGLLLLGFSLEEIGRHFGKSPATVGYWIRKYGLEPVNKEKHAARGALDRADLERLVEAGATIAEIADETARSKTTVRYWLKRYGLPTKNPVGRRASAGADGERDAGGAGQRRICGRHGETDFVLEGRGFYRCKQCRLEATSKRRRRMKAILVAEAGGKC